MVQNNNKKEYKTPKLTVYGSVETITKGNRDGDGVDAVFPISIPKNQLTFS